MHRGGTSTEGPQHLRALARANRVRVARAELKRRIAGGELTAAEVILSSPWEAQRMSVGELLASQHQWGETRCRKFLGPVNVSEAKAVGALTERQRIALACHLRGAQGAADRRLAVA